MRTRIIAMWVAAAALAAGAGCSKSNEQTASASTSPAVPTTAAVPNPIAPPPTAPPKPAVHVELEIATVANTMAYDKTAMTVPAGAEVHLVLKNNATVSTLPHNWLLVKTGTEASVAAAGLKRGDKAGYIDVVDTDMLVHTPLAKPGETSEVTFTAPEAGTYPYICSVPGHYMMMKGVLTVTP